MKIASFIYMLILTMIDLYLVYSYDFFDPTLLICLVGVLGVVSTGLLIPINSFMTKIIVTSLFSAYSVYLNGVSTNSLIIFSALALHSAALWFEAEKIGSGSRWTSHFKVTHRLRHLWFGSLGFFAGLAICYLLVKDFYNFQEMQAVLMLICASAFTLLYMEICRMHNQSMLWIDVSGPLSKSVYYWRLIIMSSVFVFGLFWFFATPATDYLVELRESIEGEDANKGDDDDGSLINAPGTRSGHSPGDVVLTSKVDIELSERPEFYVKIENISQARRLRNKPLYVSAQELIYFENKTWRPERVEVVWFKDEEDGKVDGNIELGIKHKYNVRHSVYLLREGASSIFSLTGLNSIELPEVFLSSMGVMGTRQGDTQKRKKYTVNSNFYNYDFINKRSLKVGDVDRRYLQLPQSGVISKIKNLTSKIARPQDTKVQKISRIRNFLKANCKYSLKVDNPRNRSSPLDNFIFYEKKGHCVLFASSFTLMLRAAGIPARMVNGFAGGDYDLKKGMYVMKSSNAHAWTEIYFENYGWVVCDATPEAENIAPGVAEVEEFNESEFEDMSLVEKSASSTVASSESFFSNARNLLLALLMALVILSFTWQYLKKIPGINFRGDQEKKRVYNRPIYIGAFEEYCRSRGVNTLRSRTVRELMADLMKEEDADQEILEMVQYYYHVTFANGARSEAKEKMWQGILSKKIRK